MRRSSVRDAALAFSILVALTGLGFIVYTFATFNGRIDAEIAKINAHNAAKTAVRDRQFSDQQTFDRDACHFLLALPNRGHVLDALLTDCMALGVPAPRPAASSTAAVTTAPPVTVPVPVAARTTSTATATGRPSPSATPSRAPGKPSPSPSPSPSPVRPSPSPSPSPGRLCILGVCIP